MLARTAATDGHIIVSYTPVGEGAAAGLTYRFLSEPSSDRSVHRIPSSEVKHISDARREELSAGYQEHEREARLEGTPQLGTGLASAPLLQFIAARMLAGEREDKADIWIKVLSADVVPEKHGTVRDVVHAAIEQRLPILRRLGIVPD